MVFIYTQIKKKKKLTAKWTNLKLRASNLENENNFLKNEKKVLAKQNEHLKFKVNWLLVLIGSGLVDWLASDQ